MSLENFGVEYPIQNSEIFLKQQNSLYNYKIYTFPSGNETLYQGYEHFCLDYLIYEEKLEEKEIFNNVTDMPEIWYILEGQKRKYYPDIFIPHQNRIIEVKSKYTFEKEKEKNLLKSLACKELGYKFEFRIYKNNGELLEIL